MPARLVVAAAVFVSAATHFWLWLDGFRDIHIIGPAFLLNAVTGVCIVVLLLAWRHWLPLLLATGFGAATLAAFIISTTIGLFGYREHWVGIYVWIAFVAEVLAILAGVAALLQERSLPRAAETSRSSRSAGPAL